LYFDANDGLKIQGWIIPPINQEVSAGFMTNWIVGYTDRFVFSIAMRSISNGISMNGTSWVAWELGYT